MTYNGQVKIDGVWRTVITDADVDYIKYCLEYKDYDDCEKRVVPVR